MTGIRVTGLAGSDQVLAHDRLLALAGSDDVVRVAAILDAVALPGDTTHCTAISEGGDYRASIPLAEIRSGGELAVADDGSPLTQQAGGPYRLRVVDGVTLCWNVKHVEELRLSAGELPDDVPERPTH